MLLFVCVDILQLLTGTYVMFTATAKEEIPIMCNAVFQHLSGMLTLGVRATNRGYG